MIHQSDGSGVESELRVVLVGYGLAGRLFHAPLISATRGMTLSAIVTGDPDRQQQARTELPDVSIIDSSTDLSEIAAEFDLAVVATPSGTHLHEALRAIRFGLHVVVDKPVAGTAADAALLAEEAEKCARQVHVFQNRRWDSDFLTLRELKDSGILGDIQVLESRMESLRPIRSTSWRNSPHPQDLGGVLIDLGSHLVDQALQLMGPVKTVSANTHSVRLGAEAEDYFSMFLVHEGMSTSLLVASKATPSMDFRFKALGSRAMARVGWADSQEHALRTGVNPASASWGEEPASAMAQVFSPNSVGEYSENLVPATSGQWNTFYAKVRISIVENRLPPVSLQDAIETLRVLDAARISAATDATIPLVPSAQHRSASGL